MLVELGVLRSVFFTSLSLLAYCSVACLFCCRVVAFYILSLSCHLPWVVFSEIHCFRLYILDKSKFLKFSVSSHDAMTTSLGCSHVLSMSSSFPVVIHRICFGVTIEILSLCLISLLTFQYRILLSLLKLFSVPKNPLFSVPKNPYLCNYM